MEPENKNLFSVALLTNHDLVYTYEPGMYIVPYLFHRVREEFKNKKLSKHLTIIYNIKNHQLDPLHVIPSITT